VTKDEIKLVVFILLTLAIGTLVKRVRDDQTKAAIPAVPPPERNERPPYIFKDAKTFRKAAAEMATQAP
jgi:hypothetical protein